MEATMLSTEAEKTLSFRAAYDFVEETKRFARSNHQQISQYIRDAVREKNERQLAERMRFLSHRFAAENAELNQEFDVAVGDGIA